MIATKIFYFSLLSASLMSAVSAFPTDFETNRFLYRTDREDNWTAAYSQIQPDTLDEYFVDRVNTLAKHFDHYFANLNRHVNYAENLPPTPHMGMIRELLWVRKLVFMIWYSNIRILNDIKKALQASGPTVLPPMLAAIDDEYLRTVSARYAAISRRRLPDIWIEPFTIDVAILCSLNSEMLDVLLPHFQSLRLEHYQDMIHRLHGKMSQYMRIQTQMRYSWVMNDLRGDIDELYRDEIHDFAHLRVQQVLHKLSDTILGVIAIYARPVVDGRTMLCALLESQWAIRYFIKLDLPRLVAVEVWSEALLQSLLVALETIRVVDPVHLNWFNELEPTVNRLMDLRMRRV
jgi:hypothetical protein